MTPNDFLAILPVGVLVLWATLLILVDLFIPPGRRGLTALLAALGLVVTLGLLISRSGQNAVALNNMIVTDGFASFLNIVVVASGLVGVALAYDYLKRMAIDRGEYYILLLYSICGMMLMAMAADLIVVFLALELLSIPLYVLAGFARPRAESEEAALKYFLLGSFAAGIIVYGIALVFGATTTTSLAGIVGAVNGGQANVQLLAVGAALILIGLGFKVAAVPFHMWTPDVYHGAPSAVTAFMAVGAKAGGFAALLRVFFTAFPDLSIDLTPVLWGVAAATMILGNLVAIAQGNIKRLLAYSSIAHAGYILMALVPYRQKEISQDAIASALFYLVAYALTNFAAWAVVIAVERVKPVLHQTDIRAEELVRPRRGREARAAAIGSGGVAPAGVVNAELQAVQVTTPVQERPAASAVAGSTLAEGVPAAAGVEMPTGGNGSYSGSGLGLDDYAGLARQRPALAAAMAIAMLSFTGVPPTLGFVGKLYLFRTVLEGGFIGLALIGVITSLISAYYYLRVVVIMYMRPGEPQSRNEPLLNLTALVTAVATLILVIFSGPLFQWASQAVMQLF